MVVSDGDFGGDLDVVVLVYEQVLVVSVVLGDLVLNFDVYLLGMGFEGYINLLFLYSFVVFESICMVVVVDDLLKLLLC